MSRVLLIAFAFFMLQALLSEAGLIKKVVSGVVGGNTKHTEYTTQNNTHFEGRDEYGQQGMWSAHNVMNTSRPYKNTSWHIENEDYLTPNGNESSQHKQRPSSGYGGGGTYDRKTTTSRPVSYNNYSTVRANLSESEQKKKQKPNGDLKGSPKVTTAYDPTEKEVNHSDVILRSESITCCYSNVKEEDINKRRMKCNEKDCRLEKNFDKSSLWICGDIKCTVANADFSRADDNAKLMECSMDGRNIITVQDKPVKCGKDEKAHNGRCRQIFGK